MSFEEQILSKVKYPSIFSRQLEATLFIILQIFLATRSVLKTGEYHTDIPQQLGNIQSRGAFKPITRKRKYSMAIMADIRESVNQSEG